MYSFVAKFGTSGSGNGQFSFPCGVSFNGSYIYVSDSGNHRIQIFDKATYGYVTKFGSYGTGDGQFRSPRGITVDNSYIYVAEETNHRVQVFNKSTYAFVAKFGINGAGNGQFSAPEGIAVDDSYIYVTDSGNFRVQVFNKSTYAFVGKFGSSGTGNGQFGGAGPIGIDIDGSYIYVIDVSNARVQVFNKTTYSYIGQFGSSGSGDGQFSSLWGIAVRGAYIYAGDSTRVQIFNKSTYAFVTKFGTGGSGDGQFSIVTSLAIDSSYIYTVEYYNNRVQIFDKPAELDGTISKSLPSISNLLSSDSIISSLPSYQPAIGGYWMDFVKSTFPKYSINASASIEIRSISASIPAFTANINGIAGVTGVITSNLPAYEGVVTSGAMVVLSAKTSTLTLTGFDTHYGTSNIIAKRAALSIGAGGGLSLIAKVSSLSLSGTAEPFDEFISDAKRATLSMSGLRGTLGNFQATWKGSSSLSISGWSNTSGAFSRSAKRSALTIGELLYAFNCSVMNLDTSAVTEYVGYNFNSLAVFGSTLLASSYDGLYLLGDDYDTDNGVSIQSNIKTLRDDFGLSLIKNVSDCYVGFKGGNLTIQASYDGVSGNRQSVESRGGVGMTNKFSNKKANLSKGESGRYFELKLSNVNGSDFDIDTIELNVHPKKREI